MKYEKYFLVLLGIGQIVYGIYVSVQMFHGKMAVDIHNAIILLLFATNLFIIYALYQRRQRRNLESKLRETQYLMQIEQMNYQIVEAKRTQIAKIRHDLNNQLAVVQQLLAEGQAEYAEKLLEEMEENIHKGMGIQYCDNDLVNIILNDKKQLFLQEGILLELDVAVPEKSFVEAQQLCSLFSNILQLAMEYSKNTAVSQTGNVKLQVEEHVGQFIMCCQITGCQLEKMLFSYEENLLKSVVEKYNGIYTNEEKDEMIKVQVVLFQ